MLALTNAKIYTITNGILEKGTILIQKDKIAEVNTSITIPQDAEIINLEGKVIIPGLIDAHCHTGVRGTDRGTAGEDTNEMSDPVTPSLRVIDAIDPQDAAFPELLSEGVTTVFVCPGSANIFGGQGAIIKTYGQTVEEMLVKEPAGLKMALGENPKTIHGKNGKAPVTRMAIAAILRENMLKAQEYLKKREKKPDETEINLKLEPIVQVLQNKMPARMHAHQANDIMTAIRIGKEFGFKPIIEHGTQGYLIAEHIAKEEVSLVLGPMLNPRIKLETEKRHMRNILILAKHGIKFAISTDGATTTTKWLLLNAGLAVREGLSYEEGLKSVTINPAEILGIADLVGSIEKGKIADLVVLSSEPFDLLGRPELVYINGKEVFKRK